MMQIDKTKTGIKGFDSLLQGGFPKGTAVLVTGSPGTGKTIFALEYLYNGAVKFGEKGIYVTFEEKVSELKKQALQFGWNFDKLENERKVKFVHISPTDINSNTVKEITSLVEKWGVARLVIDSISTLSINAPLAFSAGSPGIGEFAVKRFIYSFINHLKTLKDTTTLIICQSCDGVSSNDRISEFLCDGVVHITYESMGGDYSRTLLIRKMRRVKHDEDIHPLEISAKGIVIHSLDDS